MPEPSTWVILAGIGATFLTTILTLLIQIYRENRKHKQDLEREERNRKWDLADREYRATQEKKEREALAAKEAHDRKEIAAQLVIRQTIEAKTVKDEMAATALLVSKALKVEAKSVYDLLVAESARVEAESVRSRTEIAKAIEKNTVIATQARESAKLAYSEANHVNEKISALGLDHNAFQREKREVDKDMQEVAHDTHEKVVEIHEQVTSSETDEAK